MAYNNNLCPGGLMDKVAVSGAVDAGSIPARDAKKTAEMFSFQRFCFGLAQVGMCQGDTIILRRPTFLDDAHDRIVDGFKDLFVFFNLDAGFAGGFYRHLLPMSPMLTGGLFAHHFDIRIRQQKDQCVIDRMCHHR